MDKRNYTITAALPYANGPLHIGHLAGAYLPADIYARYLRSKRKNIIFVCGSDEHGVAISIKAMQQGLDPKAIIDKYHKMIGDAFQQLGISFDIYHRTSSDTHKEVAIDFFKNIYDKNIFELHKQKQYFDNLHQQFLADRYIVGICPHCSYDKAYGDQCEKCGSSLNADDLINPTSAISGNPPELKDTYHWMLPLNKFQSELEKYVHSKKNVFRNTVYQQCLSWLNQGLKPRAVTRDLNWGIPVPLKDAHGKVLYVWFEAPIGYISATKELFDARDKHYPQSKKDEFYINDNVHTNADNYESHWKSENAEIVHFIGKDNIVFHTIIFQAILLSYGSYHLPQNVVANEFLNLEGDKISTSKNWAVWLHEYLHDFPNMEDSLRYYLCATAPETKDSDFSWKAFQNNNNNELLAILGNFVNRVITLINKYFDGYIPQANIDSSEDIKRINEHITGYVNNISKALDSYSFREAIHNLIDLARFGNKYLTDQEPWKIIKTDTKKVKTILNISAHIIFKLQILSEPFLPFTSTKLKQILNIKDQFKWNDLEKDFTYIISNHKINEPKLLFRKIEDEEIEIQVQRLKNKAS